MRRFESPQRPSSTFRHRPSLGEVLEYSSCLTRLTPPPVLGKTLARIGPILEFWTEGFQVHTNANHFFSLSEHYRIHKQEEPVAFHSSPDSTVLISGYRDKLRWKEADKSP